MFYFNCLRGKLVKICQSYKFSEQIKQVIGIPFSGNFIDVYTELSISNGIKSYISF